VLALLLPLLAYCLVFLGNIDSFETQACLSFGTVFVTALLLAIDAASLGTTDLEGQDRAGPGAIFSGVLLLWVVCFPLAFFRRRHFGRPNLGLLALLVAAVFVGAPFLTGGVGRGGELPSCTQSEVISLVNEMIQKSPMGPSVSSIHGHLEVNYDKAAKVRTGQCMVETPTGALTVTYRVSWVDARKRYFQVEILPF
jgi:hypothetical protein